MAAAACHPGFVTWEGGVFPPPSASRLPSLSFLAAVAGNTISVPCTMPQPSSAANRQRPTSQRAKPLERPLAWECVYLGFRIAVIDFLGGAVLHGFPTSRKADTQSRQVGLILLAPRC